LEAAGSAVFLTHSSFSSPFRVGSHQLARVLNDKGWNVLHVSTPVTPVHLSLAAFRADYRARIGPLRRPFKEIYRRTHEYIPFSWIPWQLARLMGRQAPAFYARAQVLAPGRIRRAGFQRPDILFLDEPRLVGMARWFRPKVQIYRATDIYHLMKSDASVLIAEKQALDESAGFVATSAPVYKHLSTLAPCKPGILLENGVELDRFARPVPEPVDLCHIPIPRAVYVGALDDRFDFAAVIQLAYRRPDLSFVLIGPYSGRIIAKGHLSNIHFLGARAYSDVPGYLQHSTIGLLPMTNHPANEGRSPMKLYEYGAAGLPVLAYRTAEIGRRKLPFVADYSNETEMLASLDVILRHREVFSRHALAASQQMSWHDRLDVILQFRDQLLSN
jgi:teichuronic acid biosynthesis glycosyltransferase TuaH